MWTSVEWVVGGDGAILWKETKKWHLPICVHLEALNALNMSIKAGLFVCSGWLFLYVHAKGVISQSLPLNYEY